MQSFGLYLAIFGAGSILLNLFGYEFKILMWIDNWGETTGWAIRGAAIVIGALIWFFAKGGEQQEAASET